MYHSNINKNIILIVNVGSQISRVSKKTFLIVSIFFVVSLTSGRFVCTWIVKLNFNFGFLAKRFTQVTRSEDSKCFFENDVTLWSERGQLQQWKHYNNIHWYLLFLSISLFCCWLWRDIWSQRSDLHQIGNLNHYRKFH